MSNSLMIAAAMLLTGTSAVMAGPLHDAVERGDLDQVKQEIAKGEDVNEDNLMLGMPLHIAARGGRIAIAEVLIESGADVSANDATGTPLDAAVSEGQVRLAELLISNGASIAAKNSAGIMPIHTAASAGQIEAVEMLLQRLEADP